MSTHSTNARRNDALIRALTLPMLRGGEDLALLVLRVVTGAFLVHGVIDNITSVQRMEEFAGFLRQNRFPAPELMAPLSVWCQFFIGIAFIAGACTRWAGLLCVVNFVVACIGVHWSQDFRGWWPALVLVLQGALLATRGAGAYSVDEWCGGRPGGPGEHR